MMINSDLIDLRAIRDAARQELDTVNAEQRGKESTIESDLEHRAALKRWACAQVAYENALDEHCKTLAMP